MFLHSHNFMRPFFEQVAVPARRIGDEGRDNAKVTSATPQQICMTVYSSTGAVGEFHKIQAKLTATSRTITVTP